VSSTGPRPAKHATSVAFIAAGFAFASWAARIPQVRDRLQVSPAVLGLILLSLAFGALVALPLAGSIIHRFGAAWTVARMSVLLAVGLVVAGVGYRFGPVPVVVGLVLVGFGNGAWDVAMNVHAAAVEKQLGRSIMPRFHAGFSLGTVAGALISVPLVAWHVSVTIHMIVTAILVAASVPYFAGRFLPELHEPPELREPPDLHALSESHVVQDSPTGAPVAQRGAALTAWREPRTLLIGVFVLCAAFTEGTGNDWLGVAVIDGYHTSAVIGTSVFAVFLAAMTTARWFGPVAIDRFGRVPVLRISVGLALVGLVLVVIGAALPVAYLGTLLWGAGAALGFPVGMSAASDDPALAPRRVSVVSSIGYTAFLAGPPVIGFLGSHVGVLRALSVAAALLALATVIVPVTREPDREAGIIEPARR
jgi:MFS family permease